jgi:hypothetical protein
MAGGKGGKRGGGPWYGDERQRIVFEASARRRLASLRGSTLVSGDRAGRVYTATLEVPHYALRRVAVRFPKESPTYPLVTVDGPTSSPHRYGEHRLCMWHPDDPADARWQFEDGLLALLGIVTAHLFREAWWRETDEWPGPEAPHGELKDRDGKER